MPAGNTTTTKSRKGARGVRKVKTGCLTCKYVHSPLQEPYNYLDSKKAREMWISRLSKLVENTTYLSI
jgi:hypothetical protein